MLVKIQQTKSNFENLFEVSCDSQILFYAKAPWMNLSLPFNTENIRKLIFSDSSGNPLYTSEYNIIDNVLEESIPFKYLITKEQRFFQFNIIGKNGKEGSFYTLQKGVFDKRFCIEHKGKIYLGYNLEKGRINVISLYNDQDSQIAQITKPLVTIDNLDVYYLHIKDELSSLVPVLSFFTIYFDYSKYNNSGQLTKNSVEFSFSYSYDKNNSKYNPNWISQEFGQLAADEMEQEIGKLRSQSTSMAKKYAKIIGICFIIVILLCILVFIIILKMIPG